MRHDLGLSSGWGGKLVESYTEVVDWRESVLVDWKQFGSGSGMRVVIIGSGVCDHRDLKKTNGYNLSTGNPYSSDDHNGHTTFVSGIIAGTGEYYLKGLAPKAEICPIKILDANPLTNFRRLETALMWAKDNYSSVVLVDVELYNTLPFTIKNSIEALEKDGVPVFVTGLKNGKYDFNKFEVSFKNSSCWLDDWYKNAECIDNAMPIVAGLALLIKEKNIDMSAEDLYTKINDILFHKKKK